MKLLESMYRGDAGSFSAIKHMNTEKQRIVDQLVFAEDDLLRKYPDAETLYSQLQEYQEKLNGIELWEEFRSGFRVGAQLMAEMMEDVEENCDDNNGG